MSSGKRFWTLIWKCCGAVIINTSGLRKICFSKFKHLFFAICRWRKWLMTTWENLLESVGSSLSSSRQQNSFSSVLERSHWSVLSAGAEAGLSTLASGHKYLRPHTDQWSENMLESRVTFNIYLILFIFFIMAPFCFLHLMCRLSVLHSCVCSGWKWSHSPETKPQLRLHRTYKLVHCCSCQNRAISPHLPHVFWVGLSGEWGGWCWLCAEKWPWSVSAWSLPGQAGGRAVAESEGEKSRISETGQINKPVSRSTAPWPALSHLFSYLHHC